MFKELRLEVRSEVNTNNSKIGVKFKQKGTEKLLQEELRVNNLLKLAVLGEQGDTGGEGLGKLLSEQKGAGIDAKSESDSGCTQLWVISRALGTSVSWTQWSQVEWMPEPSCCNKRSVQEEDAADDAFLSQGFLCSGSWALRGLRAICVQ